MKEVADPGEFKKKCRRTLARILGISYLHVQSEYPLPRVERYVFGSADASRAEAGDRAYCVLPFCYSGRSKYWLAASIDLVFQQQCHLADVSLTVFEGEASDNVKIPVLRAEWDSRQESSLLMVHAQPHWHVYSSAVAQAAYIKRAEPKFGTDIRPFSPLQQPHMGEDFHFAMASQWHIVGKNSHAWDLEVDSLFRWLDGCISYIHGQLLYVST